MDETNLSKLVIVLDRLGLSIKEMDNYDFRVRFQKIVYLFEKLFKLDMGFCHSWYIKGPYCKELTDAGYSLKDMEDSKILDLKNMLNVSENVNNRINKAVEAINPYLNDTNWLELLASIHYLKSTSVENIPTNKLRLILLDKKPLMANKRYNNLDFDSAFKKAIEFISKNEK